MPNILKRRKALGTLAEIWDYLADDGEARADALLAMMDGKFRLLSDPAPSFPSGIRSSIGQP